MFNSTVLDVAIGMAFIYLLLSLLCSAASEVIAGLFNLRARNLEAGIRSLFSDGFGPGGDAFVKEIYEHGLVRGLYRDGGLDLVPVKHVEVTCLYEKPTGDAGRQLPSYIPARTFALALLDILASGNASIGAMRANPPSASIASTSQAENTPVAGPKAIMASIQATLHTLPASSAKQALESLMLSSNHEIAVLEANLEDWYNDAMDRAAGWYKRQNQHILLGLGLLIAILVNANSITLARVLWVDPGIRAATVKSAGEYLQANPTIPATDAQTTQECAAAAADPADAEKTAECAKQTAADLRLLRAKIDAVSEAESKTLLPIGWKDLWQGPTFTRPHHGEHLKLLLRYSGVSLAGWFLTAIALSLGAPFWFDLLNKFMVVRSTIKPREKSQTEGSKS